MDIFFDRLDHLVGNPDALRNKHTQQEVNTVLDLKMFFRLRVLKQSMLLMMKMIIYNFLIPFF